MKKKDKTNKKPKQGIKGFAGRHDTKTYRDLKREAIVRGIPFPDIMGASITDLINFIDHSDGKPDLSLIDKFDDWADQQLANLGYEAGKSLRSPQLRLGFIGEKDEEGQVKKQKRIKGVEKPKKPKRERDERGLYKGTKKSYTFELAAKGFSLDRVSRRVKKKFPDASDKSINIWFRNATKK